MLEIINKYTKEGFVINITWAPHFVMIVAHKGMQFIDSVCMVSQEKSSVIAGVVCELNEANITENIVLIVNRIKSKFNG